MPKFNFYNIDSGDDLGTYEADTLDEALDAMARAWAYADYDAKCRDYGISREVAITQLRITEVK